MAFQLGKVNSVPAIWKTCEQSIRFKEKPISAIGNGLFRLRSTEEPKGYLIKVLSLEQIILNKKVQNSILEISLRRQRRRQQISKEYPHAVSEFDVKLVYKGQDLTRNTTRRCL